MQTSNWISHTKNFEFFDNCHGLINKGELWEDNEYPGMLLNFNFEYFNWKQAKLYY